MTFDFSLRSRQLELEDKQSMLELELRKYMEMKGAHIQTFTIAMSLLIAMQLKRATQLVNSFVYGNPISKKWAFGAKNRKPASRGC